MPLWLSPYAIGAFLVIFLGYLATNAVLHICFYERRAEEANAWEIQAVKKGAQQHSSSSSGGGAPSHSPAGRTTDVNAGSRIPWLWRSEKTGRSPQHALYATLNLMVASSFALLTAEGTVRGIGSRLMHVPVIYRRFHKHHHFYKAPSPFDDMFIAPLEALGYYFILYSPALVVPMHVASFAVYMTVLGACGILDHSGIDVRVLGLYITRFHDAHHSHTHANYGFPFPFLDLLHDTYHGEFLGQEYVAGSRGGRGGRGGRGREDQNKEGGGKGREKAAVGQEGRREEKSEKVAFSKVLVDPERERQQQQQQQQQQHLCRKQ